VYIRGSGQGFFVNVTAWRAVYKNAERSEASGWGGATLLREIIAMDVNARGGKGRDLTRRMLYLPALIVAVVLVACAVVVLGASEKAEATFPGKNGRIAYSSFDFDRGPDDTIYTINPGRGAKTQLTRGYQPSYSPNGKRIVYAGLEGLERNDAESDIYTIKAGWGGKTQVTNNENVDDLHPSYSPDGKKIAYTRIINTDAGLPISDIYTIKVGGGGTFRVTHTNNAFEIGPSWGIRP
jgi:WD40-like Beta Propeller Repeat